MLEEEEEEEGEGQEESFYGPLYRKGGLRIRGKRALQLKRHDRQARACYQAIEHEVERLRLIAEGLRNGEYFTKCS